MVYSEKRVMDLCRLEQGVMFVPCLTAPDGAGSPPGCWAVLALPRASCPPFYPDVPSVVFQEYPPGSQKSCQ